MLICELIAKYFSDNDIHDIFGYPGGMVTYLMDAFSKNGKITQHLSYHEQGSAFCACGYAQSTGKIGVAYATSGPGATNLITGIANAYFDSIPCIFITGQVNTYESIKDLKVRQKGFQETPIIPLVKSITKYCKYIDKAENVIYELEKAVYIAKSGRMGPVLLDIPMNIQRADIDKDNIKHYIAKSKINDDCKKAIKTILDCLSKCSRPLIIAGAGIRSCNLQKEFVKFVNRFKIPTVTSMIGIDALPKKNPFNFGMLGAYGCRTANFLIEQSDLIISLGSRLDCRQTGSKKEIFATNAKLIRIDIDKNELTNVIKSDEIQLCCDLKILLPELAKLLPKTYHNEWIKKCDFINNKLSKYDQQPLNKIIEDISKFVPENSIITTDVGQNQVWVAQSFKNKANQKVLFSGGLGSMGYSLPAAIGAAYTSKKPVICFCGDGGFQMNIQELQMIARDKLSVKIILINNKSLGMIRHFQEIYFKNNYSQTVEGKGYSSPDFKSIIKSYGINCYDFEEHREDLGLLLNSKEPLCIYIEHNQKTYITPKLVVNKPIYDQDPSLPRDLIKELINND